MYNYLGNFKRCTNMNSFFLLARFPSFKGHLTLFFNIFLSQSVRTIGWDFFFYLGAPVTWWMGGWELVRGKNVRRCSGTRLVIFIGFIDFTIYCFFFIFYIYIQVRYEENTSGYRKRLNHGLLQPEGKSPTEITVYKFGSTFEDHGNHNHKLGYHWKCLYGLTLRNPIKYARYVKSNRDNIKIAYYEGFCIEKSVASTVIRISPM